MADNENDKWARARELVAEEQDLSGRYAIYKRVQALDARFAHCDRAKVLQMFEAGTNDKGEPLASSSSKLSASDGAQCSASSRR